MSLKDQEIGLLVIGILKLKILLVFLAFYVVRIRKLDKLASNSLEKDRSLKFRIFCILLLIIMEILHIILSYTYVKYYMYPYANYTLIDLLLILDYVLQLYIITRQYKKKTRRSKSIVIMWILIAIEEAIAIIIVQVFAPNIGIILPIFKVIITAVLIAITFMIEPPPETSMQNLKEAMRESKLIPLLRQISSRYGKNNQRIYVEFNKQFEVALQKDYYEYSFKIAVYFYDKFHIIMKSQTEFIKLSKDMMELFPGEEIVNLKNASKPANVANVMKQGEQKQKIYEAFLIQLTKCQSFYVEPLLTFLQINSELKDTIQKHKVLLHKKQTINTEDEEKLKRPFFIVSWRDEKIHVSNPQILDFFVNKSSKQIIAFHQKLLAEKSLKVQLLSQEPDQSELAHFIYRVVNSKSLWRVFAEWMLLGTATEDKIYNMFDFWNKGFHHLQMSVIGFQTSFDKNNSMIYYYLISINAKNSSKEGLMLKKRFNDFVKLDANIKKFIISQGIKNAHIPSLPPRFSPFESKTSPNSRRVYFDAYIKDIIKIEGINHCIKLLQFLEVDKQALVSDFYRLQQDQLAQQTVQNTNKIIESIRLDELQFT